MLEWIVERSSTLVGLQTQVRILDKGPRPILSVSKKHSSLFDNIKVLGHWSTVIKPLK
jgi:hypothetical protein